MTQKTKKIVRWIPSLIISLQIGAGAIMKFSASAFMVEKFTAIGLQHYLPVFACMELLFLALFIWRRTLRTGFFLLTAYFGGAMAVEMVHANPIAPAIILSIICLATWLREPSIFQPASKQMTLSA